MKIKGKSAKRILRTLQKETNPAKLEALLKSLVYYDAEELVACMHKMKVALSFTQSERIFNLNPEVLLGKEILLDEMLFSAESLSEESIEKGLQGVYGENMIDSFLSHKLVPMIKIERWLETNSPNSSNLYSISINPSLSVELQEKLSAWPNTGHLAYNPNFCPNENFCAKNLIESLDSAVSLLELGQIFDQESNGAEKAVVSITELLEQARQKCRPDMFDALLPTWEGTLKDLVQTAQKLDQE